MEVCGKVDIEEKKNDTQYSMMICGKRIGDDYQLRQYRIQYKHFHRFVVHGDKFYQTHANECSRRDEVWHFIVAFAAIEKKKHTHTQLQMTVVYDKSQSAMSLIARNLLPSQQLRDRAAS